MTALLASVGVALWVGERWKVPTAERRHLAFSAASASVEDVGADLVLTDTEREEVGKAQEDDAKELLRAAAHPAPPLTASEPVPRGNPGGRAAPVVRVERERRGRHEWIVVFSSGSGVVNVRSAKALSADVVGLKARGDVIIGRQEGEWIALALEPGYIKESLAYPPTTLLKKLNAMYALLSAGSCRDIGRFPIIDKKSVPGSWTCTWVYQHNSEHPTGQRSGTRRMLLTGREPLHGKPGLELGPRGSRQDVASLLQ